MTDTELPANPTSLLCQPSSHYPFRILYASDLHGSSACYDLLLEVIAKQAVLKVSSQQITKGLLALGDLEEQLKKSSLPPGVEHSIVSFLDDERKSIRDLAKRAVRAIVVGGDLCAERVVVFHKKRGKWIARIHGKLLIRHETQTHLARRSFWSRNSGRLEEYIDLARHGYVTCQRDDPSIPSDEELDEIISEASLQLLRAWLESVQKLISQVGAENVPMIIINTGTCDPKRVDELLLATHIKGSTAHGANSRILFAEGEDASGLIKLNEHFLLVSTSKREIPANAKGDRMAILNHHPRWLPYVDFKAHLESLRSNAEIKLREMHGTSERHPTELRRYSILNFHVPPRKKGLDEFVVHRDLYGAEHTGSELLNGVIDEWNPVLTLHGYTHSEEYAQSRRTDRDEPKTLSLTPGTGFWRAQLHLAEIEVRWGGDSNFPRAALLSQPLFGVMEPSPAKGWQSHVFEVVAFAFLILLPAKDNAIEVLHARDLLELFNALDLKRSLIWAGGVAMSFNVRHFYEWLLVLARDLAKQIRHWVGLINRETK